jgi:hypothetical protein
MNTQFEVARLHQAEMLRQAEEQHQVEQQGPSLLTTLGRTLVNVGERLEALENTNANTQPKTTLRRKEA